MTDAPLIRSRPPDMMHRLPATAASRLGLLCQLRDDADALLAGVNERLADARLEKANADGALRALTEADEAGLLTRQNEAGALNRLGQRQRVEVSRDEARVEMAKSRAARAAETVNMILARQSVLGERRQAFASLVDHIERWVMEQTGELQPADTAAPKLRRGENVVNAIERTRAALRDLHDQRLSVVQAPLPNDEAKRRLRQRVLTLGDSVPGPNINALLSGGLEMLQWPSRPLSIVTVMPSDGEPVTGRGTARQIDVTAVLAALVPDALISWLESSLPDDRGALTDEQRIALLGEIEARILDTERAEANLLFAALEAGADVLPRSDAAPAAVLGVMA